MSMEQGYSAAVATSALQALVKKLVDGEMIDSFRLNVNIREAIGDPTGKTIGFLPPWERYLRFGRMEIQATTVCVTTGGVVWREWVHGCVGNSNPDWHLKQESRRP